MSENELLIGLAIGDGCITQQGYLQINHSSKQYDYLMYKRQLLLNAFIKCSKVSESKPTGYGVNNMFRFRTSCNFKLKELRTYLYPDGKKIIPNNLIITPFMWSLIYQDDGRQNRISHYNKNSGFESVRIDVDPWVNRYTIYTDCFDDNSILNLQNSLLSYNVDSRISYSNKHRYPHIHIAKKESKTNFKNLILPYIHESMIYKMDLPTHIIKK